MVYFPLILPAARRLLRRLPFESHCGSHERRCGQFHRCLALAGRLRSCWLYHVLVLARRPAPDQRSQCHTARDVADAQAVAQRLGISHHTLDLSESFCREVMGPLRPGL